MESPARRTIVQAETRSQAEARQLPVKYRGIDHLALNTDDMAATIRFYSEVLGMRLVAVARSLHEPGSGQPPFDDIRHYFFDMGGDSTIAFFEYPKGAVPQGDRDTLGMMQHCALHVAPADFAAAQERLRAHGIPFLGPVDRVVRHSIYFYDNNGIRLELTTFPAGDDFETVGTLLMTRAEAMRELVTLYPDPAELERVLDAMPFRE